MASDDELALSRLARPEDPPAGLATMLSLVVETPIGRRVEVAVRMSDKVAQLKQSLITEHGVTLVGCELSWNDRILGDQDAFRGMAPGSILAIVPRRSTPRGSPGKAVEARETNLTPRELFEPPPARPGPLSVPKAPNLQPRYNPTRDGRIELVIDDAETEYQKMKRHLSEFMRDERMKRFPNGSPPSADPVETELPSQSQQQESGQDPAEAVPMREELLGRYVEGQDRLVALLVVDRDQQGFSERPLTYVDAVQALEELNPDDVPQQLMQNSFSREDFEVLTSFAASRRATLMQEKHKAQLAASQHEQDLDLMSNRVLRLTEREERFANSLGDIADQLRRLQKAGPTQMADAMIAILRRYPTRVPALYEARRRLADALVILGATIPSDIVIPPPSDRAAA